ncbi:TIGR02466 family protein [Sphaerisporangium sp. B11E5]|uniref:TIGR02466 family protein n=1 Tax=Sphaerisporangium sp. B11E5 TaxID=3153563 RepID=UPI00325EA9B3
MSRAIAPTHQGIGLKPMSLWRSPLYMSDLPGAAEINVTLRDLIVRRTLTDPEASNFGVISATKANQDILSWEHPAVDWLKRQIMDAVSALTRAVLGDAADEVTQAVIAEAWSVVYAEGGSLRPHTHHDSAWSGVYYVESGDGGGSGDAGYLQLLDPRPAAIARAASEGVFRVEPTPGRMVAFPGWLPHSVQATLTGGGRRICVAWNVAYDKDWTGMR